MSEPVAPRRCADAASGLGRELDGILVVSIEQAVAAPYCGLLLADAGARVIKVERPGGDFARGYDRLAAGQSAYFVWLNGGKQSVVLDLDRADDFALLDAMLARADIFLHNLAPGALERRGLTGERLRRTNPGLVTCEITGYGRDGPYAAMKAYDLLVQAETGLCAVTGSAEAPARVGVSICDIATGQTAFSAILRALLLRGRTGRGCDLSIAMFDVLADWMNVPLLVQRHQGRPPARVGVAHATLAPYGLYAAADGEDILIAVQNEREWVALASRVLGRPDLATDPRFSDNSARVANRVALTIEIEAVFGRYRRDALIALLTEAGIACARLNTVADLALHPQLRERTVSAGPVEIDLAALPVGTGAHLGRVPDLDEHGAAIRAEFAAMAALG